MKCGKTFDQEEMSILPGVHCPYCGYKIIMKVRPPIVKRVKASSTALETPEES
ncbi:MAG: DNA-directed RNA polymerase subunit P [Thermoprotei archaeon]|nr:MAG: DNA-directed RNA polymerase subunit P [Thermoprotei archaeon]RLE98813.1 MAG: DNA-directed RNA polymerase subunit P [Thermoprotei archaeon]